MRTVKGIFFVLLVGSCINCAMDYSGYTDQLVKKEVTLLLSSEPPGARIYEEGKLEGKTPMSFSYTLEFKARWYQGSEKPVFLFQDVPDGAWQTTKPITVLMDGYEAQTKQYRFNAAEAAYKSEFSILFILEPLPGAKPSQQQQQQQQQTVILNPDRGTQRNYGALTIMTTPPQAEIYIDGSFVASSPASSLQIEAGQHKIEIMKTGYETWMRIVQVLANSPVNIDVTLEKKSP